MNNLYLIGYRGAGKSTLAPMLARQLGWSCVELDDLIEAQQNSTISEIFSRQGEAAFRDLETAMLQTVAGQTHRVVSTGGGIVLREVNRQLLRQTGTVIWLTASPDTLFQRLAPDGLPDSRRPALTPLSLKEEIRQLVNARTPLYAVTSHFTVDTESHKLEEIVQQILTHLHQV